MPTAAKQHPVHPKSGLAFILRQEHSQILHRDIHAVVEYGGPIWAWGPDKLGAHSILRDDGSMLIDKFIMPFLLSILGGWRAAWCLVVGNQQSIILAAAMTAVAAAATSTVVWDDKEFVSIYER